MSMMEGNEMIQIEKQTTSSCEGLNISNGSDSCKEREIMIEVESIENILSISSCYIKGFGENYANCELMILSSDHSKEYDTTKVKEISIKMEFKGQILVETDSIMVPETGECAANVSSIIPMEEPSPQFLDDILSSPVIFTVIDRTFSVKPDKDMVNESKKDSKRDSKKAMSRASLSIKSIPRSSNASFTVLGICNLDLGPIIKGRKLIKERMILELEKNGSGKNLVSWPKLPRLSAFASTGEEPLIPQHFNVLNNIINITVESVYNVPRNIEEGTPFEAQILIPNFGDKLNAVVYPNGMLTSVIDCECMKRWATLSHIEGRGALTKHKVNPDTSDIINPDNEIPDLEKVLRTPGPRIHWNKWRSSIMVKTGSNYFFERLTRSRVWPIEVAIATRPTSQKTGKGEKRLKTASVTSSTVPERYVAYLRLGSLLYPGVTRVRVASRLYCYSPLDIAEKCGRDFVIQSGTNSSFTKAKTGDKVKSSGRDTEESKDSPGTVLCNEDGKPVFIIVEVEVWKPYIIKREPEYFFKRFSSYFPPKEKVSKKKMNLNLARRNFSKVIEQLSYYIKDCYEKFNLLVKSRGLYFSIEDGFIQHLCQEGIYQKIKWSLEDKILDLVSEKFGDVGKQNEKITEVFIDLVNEMHNITNKFKTFRTDSSKTTLVEANGLQLSAEEAIEDGDYNLAGRYLLQKLWSNKLNSDYWLDYALYLIALEDYEKCVESIREALSLDMEHQIGLLMYGLIMTKLNDVYLAELAFKVLLAKYPDFIEGWMILHLFYSEIGNLEGAEYTLQRAYTLENELTGNGVSSGKEMTEEENSFPPSVSESGRDYFTGLGEGRYGIASFSTGRTTKDPLSWTVHLDIEYNFHLKTAILLLRLRSFELAESMLIRESHRGHHGPPLEYLYYIAVSHYLRKRYSEALSHLQTAVEKYGKNCFLWGLMGHCYYKLHNYDSCIKCYEYVIESYSRPNDIHLIYVRMGKYYMKTNKYKCAKKYFLCASKYSPSSKTWLGVGVACYNLGEFEDSETALMEANYLDNMCPVVWAYLTLVNVQLERYDVVELCYAEAKKKNLKNEGLIAQIESLMEVHRLMN